MTQRLATEALRRLLLDLPERIAPERIDEIWIFWPREVAGKESALVVLSLLPGEGVSPGQRQVMTLRYEAERVRGSLRMTQALTEQGWAPAERLPAVIAGVMRRLEGEPEDPHSEAIRGERQRWTELVQRFHSASVDRPTGE